MIKWFVVEVAENHLFFQHFADLVRIILVKLLHVPADLLLDIGGLVLEFAGNSSGKCLTHKVFVVLLDS